MADNKQYITQPQENGNIYISEDVIATIVAHAVGEVEGVAGLSNHNKKGWGRGPKVVVSQDEQLSIECNVIVFYGQSVFDVAKAVQAAITSSVESMTGISVQSVNVNVSGIIRK